ncbi:MULTISPECIES: AraC family transcriptional regulator [unclassified Bosea (in: a-proteobacteria)]|uniref:helix-turn-helix domain-containing protein n=1 Tax=unclassified Bosea (in: a-proteobacteria) TaxID=2653178 RepID=UPI000F750096|nr:MULTISPECIES: AraC family transcriptional regulator [unclassified Bosea (in: a-proteobacteria)]AZO77937.1 AraC family transcriptional regulator [Bosea sp. Tri-49]RXT19306.1 AraC family transcriptional regulator [Bosea sp. Tri-39]RXT41578.1 AraC family transcriptional regulator [Bosea sp. Tri-54]
MADESGTLGNAPASLGRILDRAPPVTDAVLRGDTRLTAPWGHGALHDYLPGMAGHVVITYYGEPQEIVWRSAGERLAGKTRSGTITIIPQGHDGRWDIAGPIGVSHVFLPHQRLLACAEQLTGGKPLELLGRVGFEDPIAARVMEMLGRDAGAAADPAAQLFVEQATDLLVVQLLRGHSSFGAIAAPAQRGLADWQVRKVTSYMQDHLGEAVGLDDLAALVGLSRFHFCTAFRKATGRTPHAQLVELRMDQARRLLTSPELAVTDIALTVGYETPSSFTAAFRKATGVTPSAFRQRL